MITNIVATALATRMSTARAGEAALRIGYLRWPYRQPTISLLDKPAPDEGLAGARLAIADNNTTGLLSNGRAFVDEAPWISLAPGLAMAVTVIGISLLGDGLRELLDPRLRGRR